MIINVNMFLFLEKVDFVELYVKVLEVEVLEGKNNVWELVIENLKGKIFL